LSHQNLITVGVESHIGVSDTTKTSELSQLPVRQHDTIEIAAISRISADHDPIAQRGHAYPIHIYLLWRNVVDTQYVILNGVPGKNKSFGVIHPVVSLQEKCPVSLVDG